MALPLRPYITLDGSTLCWLEVTPILCAATASLGAFLLIAQHFRCLKWPALQKQLVRVTLFIPVVCIVGILSVMYPQLEDILEVLVALYEPVAFHCFWEIMMIYAGGPAKVDQHLRDPDTHKPGALCCRHCRSPSPSSRKELPGVRAYEWRVAQFCLLKPVFALCVVVVDHFSSHTYLVLVFTLGALFSTVLAMLTLLVLERRLLHAVLTGLGAFCKFWAIKLIILLIILQGLVINLLSQLTFWHRAPGFSVYRDWKQSYVMSRTLQFFVLVEMVLVALPLFWRGYSLATNRHVLERAAEAQALLPVTVTPRLVLSFLFLGPMDCARFTFSGLRCRPNSTPDVPPPDSCSLVEPEAPASDVTIVMLDPERRPSSRRGHQHAESLLLEQDQPSPGVPAEEPPLPATKAV